MCINVASVVHVTKSAHTTKECGIYFSDGVDDVHTPYPTSYRPRGDCHERCTLGATGADHAKGIEHVDGAHYVRRGAPVVATRAGAVAPWLNPGQEEHVTALPVFAPIELHTYTMLRNYTVIKTYH
jgi:hypothetical protein